MKGPLATIRDEARELAELAQDDIECIMDDFCEKSYRDSLAKISAALDAVVENYRRNTTPASR